MHKLDFFLGGGGGGGGGGGCFGSLLLAKMAGLHSIILITPANTQPRALYII